LYASRRNEPGGATINSDTVPDKSENMEHNSFQSEFACELDLAAKDIDQLFKSEFATDLQSSLVIVNDTETVDEEEKLFDDSNYSYLEEDHQSEQVNSFLNCCN
jgi:hypothetical protein